MKSRSCLYALILILFLGIQLPSKAQFFKKLKKTVKEMVATPGQQTSSTKPSGVIGAPDKGSSTAITSATSSNAAKKGGLIENPTALGIEVIARQKIDFNNQYIALDYTSIVERNNKAVATIPVGNFSHEEALSELGRGSPKDVTDIYENGRKVASTTYGGLDSHLVTLNKQYNYPYGKELVRSSNPEADNYILKTNAALSTTIKFAGKKYGPYMLVGDLFVNNNKDRFFAQICVDMADAEKGNYTILGMDGKKRKLTGGGDLIANLNFTSAAVLMSKGGALLNASLHETSEAKAAELQAASTKISVENPNMGSVYFLSGKTLTDILIGNPWLDMSGQNFFSGATDVDGLFEKGTYLNGKNIYPENIHQGQGWCNADGTSWALEILQYANGGPSNHLHFSDGTDIFNVYFPHELFLEGKYYIVWFCFDHAKSDELVVYQKAL